VTRIHPSSIPCLLAALLSVLSPACNKGDPARPAFRAVQRPQLKLVEGVRPATQARRWLSIDPTQPGTYEIVARNHEVVPDPADPKAPQLHRLRDPQEKRVRIPLAQPAGRFDRLRARINIDRFGSLELRWSKDGKLLGTELTQLFPHSGTGDYTIDVPVSAPRDPDLVELVIAGGGPVCLGRIDFEELAAAQRLPQPPDPPAWVRASEDVRSAWGLATTAPLEVSFTPPEGAFLLASAIVPQALRVPGSEPVLSLTLFGAESEARVHRWQLVPNEGLSSAWTCIRLPLTGLAGRPLRARFELLSSGDECVCALTQPQVVEFEERAPTVLLITSDTHRGDYVGCATGSVGVATPVLDRLASQGVLFERCMATANVTIPSHAAIMTGVSPRDSGLFDNMHALAPEALTLAERFRDQGWATIAGVSAAHLDAAWCGLGQGFDRVAVSSPPKRGAGATLSMIEGWIPEYRGQPLFVWVHLFDAHTPYSPPPAILARYWPSGRDPRDPALPAPPPGSIPIDMTGVRDVDWIRANYEGEATYLDNELVRLFGLPRIEDAIIAFTADHGESLGGHGVWWDHAGMYQDSLHVPLILRWPGGPRGAHVVRRVSNLDLGRTLLDLADLGQVEMPGRSLLRAVDGTSEATPVFAVAALAYSASITDGDEHLVLHLVKHELAPGEQREKHASELYDLARDPACVHDLSGERAARAKALRARLIAWLRAAESRPWSRRPEGNGASIDQLNKLGYVEGQARDPSAALFPAQCDCSHCSGGK